MKLLSDYIEESLLTYSASDAPKSDLFNQMNTLWLKEHASGKFKVYQSNWGLNIEGEVYIDDFDGEAFPPLRIRAVDGISIAHCKNVKSLTNLFDPRCKVKGVLEIDDCPSLENIDDIPKHIKRLYISDCKALKNIEPLKGLEYIEKLSLTRIGRRYKEDFLRNMIPATVIKCAAEPEYAINESIINESFKVPEVRELFDRLNTSKQVGVDVLLNNIKKNFTIDWQNVNARYVDTFDLSTGDDDKKYNSEKERAISACRKLYNDDVRGIVYVQDPKGEIVRVGLKDSAAFCKEFYWKYAASYYDKTPKWSEARVSRSERDALIINWKDPSGKPVHYTATIISVPKSIIDVNIKKKIDRQKARTGVVENTPEYYKKIAEENRARYKAALQSRKASGETELFVAFAKKCEPLYQRVGKIGKFAADLDKRYVLSSITRDLHGLTTSISEMLGYNDSAIKRGTVWTRAAAADEYKKAKQFKESIEKQLTLLGI